MMMSTPMSPEWLTPPSHRPVPSTLRSNTYPTYTPTLRLTSTPLIPRASHAADVDSQNPTPGPPMTLDIYLRELGHLITRTRTTSGGTSQVDLTSLSLREFIAMALLGHHCKAPRAEGFLQTQPTAGDPMTFKIVIQGGILVQGITLIAHEDEFPSGDIRKRNNKTCVFGCFENVTLPNGQERMVRQHLTSQTYPPFGPVSLAPRVPRYLTVVCYIPISRHDVHVPPHSSNLPRPRTSTNPVNYPP